MQQDHESLHAESNQKVAVMVDLDELNGTVALSKLKHGRVLVRPSSLDTSHLIVACHKGMLQWSWELHMMSLRACCETKKECLSED